MYSHKWSGEIEQTCPEAHDMFAFCRSLGIIHELFQGPTAYVFREQVVRHALYPGPIKLNQVRQYILLAAQGPISLHFLVMVLGTLCAARLEEECVCDWLAVFVLTVHMSVLRSIDCVLGMHWSYPSDEIIVVRVDLHDRCGRVRTFLDNTLIDDRNDNPFIDPVIAIEAIRLKFLGTKLPLRIYELTKELMTVGSPIIAMHER